MFEMKMVSIYWELLLKNELQTDVHAGFFFMTFLVMTEKAAEGRREGLSQAHSLRTYSIIVVKDWGRSVKEHEVAGMYYT